MRYDKKRIEKIYRRTDGRCHLCSKKLSIKNYAMRGARGAWEVDHSKAKAAGGTDHLNNLFAACISCNRSKQARSNRPIRKKHGRNRAPFSREKKREAENKNMLGSAVACGLFGLRFGLPGVFVGILIGLAVGSQIPVE